METTRSTPLQLNHRSYFFTGSDGVSSATTTKEVWDLLASTFGNPTRGHIRQLKKQIEICVKGTQTISDYLRTIKSKADELALLGKPMDPEDLT